MTCRVLSRITLAAAIVVSQLASGCSSSSSQSSSGSPVGTPSVALSASSLSFTATAGATSGTQSVTLTNTGNAALTVSSISLAGTNASSFSTTNTCGTSVAAGAACSLSVSFAPSAAGSFSASLSIADNATGSPQSIALSGTATAAAAPALQLSATALSFTTNLGTAATAQVLTLTNTGSAPLIVSGISLAGTSAALFSQTNTCATVAAGSTCSVTVNFAPTAAGTFTASLSIADNVAGSPQTVALSGTANAPALQLSATTLSFSTNLGTAAGAQLLILTNSGNAPLVVSSISLTGTNAGSFSETNACATIAAGATCSVTVNLTATGAGTYSAGISIADNATGSPQAVTLTGTISGPVVSVSSSSFSFTTAAESTSAAQTLTVKNTGNGTLTISSLGITGGNTASFLQTNTCGTSLSAGSSCTVALTFAPFLATTYSSSLVITGNTLPANQTVALSGTGTGTLAINTSSATNWIITNGALTINWNSTTGNVFGVQLTGYPDQLVDTTYLGSNGQPDGLYMDNTGPGSGTPTSGYSLIGNEYIDWWITVPSNSANAFTTTQHFLLSANDTGFHVYSTVGHSATDIAGSIGQWQYVFRISQTQFVETYSVNAGLGNLGVIDTPLPSPTYTGTTDPGRQVQNAAVDLHGFPLPTGFTREFFTKYDYSSYEYLHKEHGVYGAKYGAWTVIPSTESMVGGPTKQDLIFTDNILMMEALSSHLDNNLAYTPPQGTATNRLFGPYYFHFNAFNTTNTTPAALYSEAQTWLPQFNSLYDADATLAATGYPASTARGTVSATIANTGTTTANAAWTVLSDSAVNYQYSSKGKQYWLNNGSTGAVNFTGVAAGTYRLSSYVLGQWGEMRQDNVTVTANGTTNLGNLTFTPENFGTAAPIWTIGTPDRSGHEFLHGHDTSGNDLRNFYGAYNFWQDFASTSGAQVYYATAVGTTPASNNLSLINYNQWQVFDPGLYAGVYNAADDTTDGYIYAIPTYVKSLSTASGTNGVTTPTPNLAVHFTTTAAQQAQGQYVVLSLALACAEGSPVLTLNGHQLVWHYTNASDCMIRSGVSGYTAWIAFQWPTSQLNAPGVDNVLTFGASQPDGYMLDAMRMEITNTSADPAVTGWNDYEYVNSSKYTPANDAVPNP